MVACFLTNHIFYKKNGPKQKKFESSQKNWHSHNIQKRRKKHTNDEEYEQCLAQEQARSRLQSESREHSLLQTQESQEKHYWK